MEQVSLSISSPQRRASSDIQGWKAQHHPMPGQAAQSPWNENTQPAVNAQADSLNNKKKNKKPQQ